MPTLKETKYNPFLPHLVRRENKYSIRKLTIWGWLYISYPTDMFHQTKFTDKKDCLEMFKKYTTYYQKPKFIKSV